MGSCSFYSKKGISNYKFASIPTFVVQEVQKTPKPKNLQTPHTIKTFTVFEACENRCPGQLRNGQLMYFSGKFHYKQPKTYLSHMFRFKNGVKEQIRSSCYLLASGLCIHGNTITISGLELIRIFIITFIPNKSSALCSVWW